MAKNDHLIFRDLCHACHRSLLLGCTVADNDVGRRPNLKHRIVGFKSLPKHQIKKKFNKILDNMTLTGYIISVENKIQTKTIIKKL